jgi:hypothetical protein
MTRLLFIVAGIASLITLLHSSIGNSLDVAIVTKGEASQITGGDPACKNWKFVDNAQCAGTAENVCGNQSLKCKDDTFAFYELETTAPTYTQFFAQHTQETGCNVCGLSCGAQAPYVVGIDACANYVPPPGGEGGGQ